MVDLILFVIVHCDSIIGAPQWAIGAPVVPQTRTIYKINFVSPGLFIDFVNLLADLGHLVPLGALPGIPLQDA